MNAPTHRHLKLLKRLKRVLSCVSGNLSLGLHYSARLLDPHSLDAAVDVDWGGCKETRRSTTGFLIDVNGSLVFWRRKRQSVITFSSAEAEYVALSSFAEEVSWFRKLYWELVNNSPWSENSNTQDATQICLESTAPPSLARNSQASARKKHIDLKIHHVREILENGVILLQIFSSKQNLADVLQK